FLVPFLLPPYIAALSWMMALQPGGYLMQLTGIHLGALLFSPTGIILIMALGTFPVVYFAVSRSLAAAGGRLADVGRVCGATPWRAFFRITLPLALPALAACMLLTFTLAIEEYGVPAALGSQAGFLVLTTAIERRLSDWPIDLSGAAMLALLLVSLALLAYALQRAMLAGRRFETTNGKPVESARRELGPWRVPVLLLFTLISLLAVAVPIASMLASALTRTLSGGLSLQNFSLDHFSALLEQGGEPLQALSTSLSLAVGTALLAGLVGFASAWCVHGQRIRAAGWIDALSLLPASLPGVVVGVGLILAWNQSFWPVTPYGTWVILLLSYTCLLLPYPVRYVSAALAQIDASLEAAARVHGAGVMRSLRHVTLPLALPSLVAAMLMVFAVASRELVTSLLLAPAGVQTVSIFVWRQFEQGTIGQGMAMAVVAAAISLSLMLLGMRLQGRQTAGPG
ncbi:ABC transporter permease subunit, partial [Pseudomonas sp. S 311-6]|nr:ABC transporter permease subunit [Pseudomonas sp. S 311-6]